MRRGVWRSAKGVFQMMATDRRRDWICGLCGAAFDEKDQWADHLYEAHGETDDEVYDDPGDQGGDK